MRMRTFISSQKIDTILKYILWLAILVFIVEYVATVIDARVIHVIDAQGYYRFSLVPFFTSDFWFGMRPVGYPLFIKLLHSNPNLVIAVQTLFHIFTWSFFAIYIFDRANNKLIGLLSSIGLLFIALQPNVAAWSHHVLTESLTFNFIPWIYMSLYEFLISKNKKYLYYLLGILVYYSTLRDVNAYYVLSFVLIFGILFWYKYINRLNFFIATIILIASFAFSDYTANHSRNTISGKELTFVSNGKRIANRWVFPFMNIMGRIVLNNPDMLEYMKKEGMPVDDALLKQKNKWGGEGWYDKPELQKFRDWLVKSGKQTYMKYLITHPKYTFGSIYKYRHHVFHYNMVEQKWHYQNYLPGYQADNIFKYSQIPNLIIYKVLIILLLIILLYSIFSRKNIINKVTLPIFALIIPIILLSVITFHGDGVDLFRHTIIIPFLVKVTAIMLIYVLGNELLNKKEL